MPKELNSYTPEHLQYLFELYSGRVLKTETEPESFNSLAAAYHVKMDNSLSAAFVSYALDRERDEITGYLKKALAASKQLLAEPRNRFVNPVMMADGMHIALILGKKQDATLIAGQLPADAGDYEQGSFVVDRLVMGYIHCLSGLILERDEEVIRAANAYITENKKRNAGFVKEYLDLIALLVAIAEKNQSKFERQMAEFVHAHALKASTGDLSESPEALICLKGLSLTALGIERGLTLPFKSDYLPLDLLGSAINS